MIVPDASVIAEVLLRTPVGESVVARLLHSGVTLHAPHLIDLEIAQVFRRLERTHEISPGRSLLALEAFMDIRLIRYPHDPLLPRIWDLRKNVTAYDAAYLALAEALEAPLLTCDRALAGVSGCSADVEIL